MIAYKVTTKRKHNNAVADNLLNQIFNPLAVNEVWAGDITYLRTAVRLAVFGDCHRFIFAQNR